MALPVSPKTRLFVTSDKEADIIVFSAYCTKLSGQHKLDEGIVKNAFNTISRKGCLLGIKERCPSLLPWATWSWSGASLIFGRKETITCTSGVQQGDPISPVAFACGLQEVIEKLASEARSGIWTMALLSAPQKL